jgi:hypothetical protein
MATLFAEDVSHHVEGIWKPHPDSVLTFIKVTQGGNFVSPAYARLVAKARAAGQTVGHYHCVETLDQGRGTIAEQAARFAAEVFPLIKDGDLLAVDFEPWARTDAYEAKHGVGGGVRAINAEVEECITLLAAAFPKHRLLVYMSLSRYIDIWKRAPVADGLWLAWWPALQGDPPPTTVPAADIPWVIWQTQGGEHHPTGIDQNKVNFATRTEFDKWRLSRFAPPPPPPPPPPFMGGVFHCRLITDGFQNPSSTSKIMHPALAPGYNLGIRGNPTAGWYQGDNGNYYRADHLVRGKSVVRATWYVDPAKVTTVLIGVNAKGERVAGKELKPRAAIPVVIAAKDRKGVERAWTAAGIGYARSYLRGSKPAPPKPVLPHGGSATARTTFEGRRTTTRTVQMIKEVRRLTGFRLPITQGGYNKGGVSASAGTHDRDAADLGTGNLNGDQCRRVESKAWAVGFAGWWRRAVRGLWGQHHHLIPRGGDLSAGARRQVVAADQGRNGLASNSSYPGIKTYAGRTWERYQRLRDGAKIKIGGKWYPDPGKVSTVKVIAAWKSGTFSVPVAIIQMWLKRIDRYPYAVDGKKGMATQTGLDNFRRSLGWKGADVTGLPGIASLSRLRDAAKSPRKVVA